jgi:putative ABC transport system permease protein
MLLHKKSRYLLTSAGVGVAFFLTAAQFGLLVGWCGACSAIVRNAGVDLWVMAPQTPAFDYGTAIPGHRIRQVRNVRGVAWAEGMFMGWNIWHRPDGRRVTVELVGLDDSFVGGPWHMKAGRVAALYQPDAVIVDELYLPALGVHQVGDDLQVFGRRAVVSGISRDIRTTTASPFVFTSLKSALRFDPRYRHDEITYVLVRCSPGQEPARVRDTIMAEVPHVEALTTWEFALRTMRYWLLETGLGFTVVVTAILGLVVAAVIISQTLFAITQDHLSNYATLLALGFGRCGLCTVVVFQSLVLGGGGILCGCGLYFQAAWLCVSTPIPLHTDARVLGALMGVCLLCCVFSSLASIRSLFRIDPVSVFRS